MDSIGLLRQEISDYKKKLQAEFEKLENTKAYISRGYWSRSIECEREFTAHILKFWEHTLERLEEQSRYCSDIVMEPKLRQFQSQAASEMHSVIQKLEDMRLDKENARHYEISRCHKCIEQVVDKVFMPLPHDGANLAEACRLASILLTSEPSAGKAPRPNRWDDLEAHILCNLQSIDIALAKQLGNTEINTLELERLSSRLTANIKPYCGISRKGLSKFTKKSTPTAAHLSAAEALKITAAVNEAVKRYFKLRYVEDIPAEEALRQVGDGFEDEIAL